MIKTVLFKKTTFYIVTVSIIAFILLYTNFSIPSYQNTSEWMLFLLLVGAILISNKYPIYLPPKGNGLTVDSSIYLASLFILGLDITLALLFFSTAIFSLYYRKVPLWKHLFNLSMLTITIAISYYIFIILGGQVGLLNLVDLYSYILALTTYLFINIFLFGLYFVFDSFYNAKIVMRGILEESLSNYFIILGFALILTILLGSNPIFGVLIFTLVIVLISKSLSEYHLLYEEVSNDQTYREQIMNSLSVGIITFDNRISKYNLNSTAESILNVKAEKVSEFVNRRTRNPNKSFWEALSSKKINHSIKVNYQTAEKSYILLLSQSDLLDQFEQPYGKVFSFIDITESEELEKRIFQSKKLALLGEISAKAAHEIRNPLTVIFGFLSLMKQSLSESEQNKFQIPLMLNEFDRINSIVDEMLSIAKPSKPVLAEVCIEEIVNEVLSLYNQSSFTQDIDFKIDLEHVPLLLDKPQITQVMYNLIRNSSEAITGKGTISIYSKVLEGNYQLFIQDTGSGIPGDIQRNIFDPFLTSKDSGTGLGLTIIQRIIENHNGKIELYSSSDNGTTFIVTLPLSNPNH